MGKSRLIVVCMRNNIIINNTRINSVSCTHNYKLTFAPHYISIFSTLPKYIGLNKVPKYMSNEHNQ